ncbi:MAG: hypothetical protein JJU31_13845 [Wenzhouxiangella sp.]|nr:hypothetical protein [Wenzhouxiangella sp.]MCH8478814.1 hypothetical protein [Wenzhouxiangella sp.]
MATARKTGWKHVDADTLIGHYLIAGLDGRLDDREVLGTQLISRRQLSAELHQTLMRQAAEQRPLPRPIIAGPDN